VEKQWTQICKDVGHDGESYFCLRCGKAEFQSVAAARGHLGYCKGRMIQKGILPVEPGLVPQRDSPLLPVAAAPAPAPAAISRSLAAAPAAPAAAKNTTQVLGGFGVARQDPEAYPQHPPPGYFALESRIGVLENERHHLLLSANGSGSSWFDQNKTLLLIGGFLLALILLSGSGQCSTVGDVSAGSRNGIKEKALAKLLDRSVSKTVDMVFKGI